MFVENEKIDLSALRLLKLPLRYGTDSCYITLTDNRFATETVALRNTPELGKYINYAQITLEDQDRWLEGQLVRQDAQNFAIIGNQRFAGTVSLYDILHGVRCEYGRLMIPDDGRRIYALAAEILCMSYAFEILGVKTLYCVVMKENNAIKRFHLKNGWQMDTRYDRFQQVNGQNAHLLGMSVERPEWPKCFAKMCPLAKRLLRPQP